MRHGAVAKEFGGAEPATTNNRMELTAAIGALRALKEPCEVDLFTDSEYLWDGITSWVASWKSRNWRTADRKPVKNEDLWLHLDELCARHKIRWHWLKGHAGHPDNERCDKLARAELAKLRKQYTAEQLRQLLKAFEESRAQGRNKARIDFFEPSLSRAAAHFNNVAPAASDESLKMTLFICKLGSLSTKV